MRGKLTRDYWIIKFSGLFDPAYYLRRNPDVRQADIDPLEHFVLYGWKEGRNPNEWFDLKKYADENPEVLKLNINPLVHFIKKRKEKREKRWIFSAIKLAIKSPDYLVKFFKTALRYGLREAINKSKQKVDSSQVERLRYNQYISGKKNHRKQKLPEDKILEFVLPEQPVVSIIIPCHNKWEYTYNCLLSIYQNTDLQKIEIIIADDDSTDLTRNINDYMRNIRVVKNIPSLGFLKNCNEASRIARGKYLLFLNNDTEVTENWLEFLLEVMERDSEVGLVGPKFIYPDGRLQEAGGIIWSDGTGWNYGRMDDPLKPEYNYVREVDYISGACILIRRELWEDIGGFDERYSPAYYEDTDLAFEVRRRGYKVVYQPESVVIHHEGVSHGTDTSCGIKKYQDLNRLKFVEKWKDILQKEHLPSGVDPFLARDRSKFRKHVLIIDHYFPEPDRDAGSRVVFMYTKIFKELGFKVMFLSDNFNKSEPYTFNLQQLGVEAIYGHEYSKNWKSYLREIIKYIDLVFLNRAWISEKYVKFLTEIRKKESHFPRIIYCPHDLSFIRLQREYEVTKNEAILNEAENMRQIEHYIISNVDAVLLFSTVEKEYLEREFDKKSINIIPAFVYEGEFPLSKNNSFSDRRGIFFIGGFRHRPNYYGVKWFIENCWEPLKEKIADIEFLIAGSEIPDDIRGLSDLDPQIRILGQISDEQLREIYDNIRIVVAPLTFGAGVKGKIVEAIAHGVPVVTTSIGAEGIPDVENILLVADTPEEFVKHIVDLYIDERKWTDRRNAMINYSQKYLSKDYGKKVILELVNKILNIDYGFCTICGNWTVFENSSDNSGEIYICNICRSVSRDRYLAKILINVITNGKGKSLIDLIREYKNLSIYEILSSESIHNYLKVLKNYVCSKHQPDLSSGSRTGDRIHDQDLQSLNFESCSFDIVISQDIVEYVRDKCKALQEIYRILKPGGFYIFAVSSHRERPDVYHKDTAYTDFEYDLISKLKETGFETQVFRSTEEDFFLHRINRSVVFVSTKPR